MRAIYGHIIVVAYQHQKDELTIKGKGGKPINLFVGKKFLENHREKNPVLAEVLDNNSKYKYIKKGDLVVVHHNLIDSPDTNQFCIEYNPQTGMGVFCLPAGKNFFCKIDKKTGKAHPICNNIITKRLANPVKSDFIIIPDTVKQEHNDRVEILEVSPEVEDLKAGTTVLIYQKADYEIVYTFNKKEHRIIKVFYEDVLGTIN